MIGSKVKETMVSTMEITTKRANMCEMVITSTTIITIGTIMDT